MRLVTYAILLTTAMTFQASAKSYAQNVTLNVKNTSLKEVFIAIKHQTGYSFFWKDNLLDNAPKVSLNVNNANISQALNACLSGTQLVYSVQGKIIYITQSPNKTVSNRAMYKDVSGIVYSAKDSTPIVGASVQIKGTSKGTFTNSDGRFTIQANEGDVLEISSVGYVSASIIVSDQNSYEIRLAETVNNMDSVVVVAFGMKASQRSVPFAVTSINNAQLTNAGTDNVSSALAGKMPGVDIVAMSGGPMGGTRINLRGTNSLNGNSRPLIVLNGIPIMDNDVAYTSRGFGTNLKNPNGTGTQLGSTLDDINPNDIESITTLNGANAAALYGSQAMNGAIVIETKTGREQKGLGVDYSMNLTKNSIYGLPDFQQEYGAGASADIFDKYVKNVPGYDSIPFYAPGGSLNTVSMAFGPKLEGQPVLWWDGQVRPWSAQPNNYQDFFNNGYSMNHSVGVSGSDEKSSFRLSGSFYDYKGLLPNMKENRYSVFFSGSRKISKIITADVYLNYIYNFRQNPPQRIDRAGFSIYPNNITSLLKANTINSRNYEWSDSAASNVNGSNLASNIINPLYWDPMMNRNQDARNTFIGTATITIKPSQHLSIRLRGGTNRLYEINELKQAFTAYASPSDLGTQQGNYSKSLENDYTNHFDGIVTYNNDIKKDISLNAFAGFSVDDSYAENNTISAGNGLMFNGMYSAANFKPRQVGPVAANANATQSGYRFEAAFASASIGYKNWLFLNMTDRVDWSSYLPKPNNRVNYPSIGGSFIFTEALKLPAFINFGKLRASYGVVGVFGQNYSSNTTYKFNSFNGAVTGDFSNPTYAYSTNISPQINKSYEFGLETGMWNNRLRTNITYYINKTTNMILGVPVAYSTGGDKYYMNSGSLQNKGLEVQLIGDIVRNDNFKWTMTLNGTSVSRKVTALASGLPNLLLANPFSASIKAAVGGAPMDIYMSTLMRDATTGKVIVDANGEPQFNPVQTKVGNLLAKVYGGYTNSFTYKHLTLTALLEYRFGGQVISYDNQYWSAAGLTKNTLFGRDAEHGGQSYYVQGTTNIPLANGQQAPNGAFIWHDGILFDGVNADGTPNTTIVKASKYYQDRYFSFGREDAVFDNSYIRLREVSISYDLPQSLVQKIHFKGLSVSLIARNLWFLYKTVPYNNPDNSLGTNDFNTGVLYSGYPLTRDIGISLNAKF